MGPNKIGVKYGVPSVFYPRFSQFHRRLISIVPRLKNILDKGNLTQCIPDGKVQSYEIKALSKQLEDRVKITVVGEQHHEDLMELDQELRVWKGESKLCGQELVQWATVLNEIEKTNKHSSHFLVYVINWCTVGKIQDLEGLFSSLSEDQMSNIIIFDRVNNKNFQYTDVKDCKGDTLPDTKHSTSISQHLQFLLEKKAIEIIGIILEYVKKFVPKPGVVPDQTLLDECSTKMRELFKNQSVLDDLEPKKDTNNETEEMEVDCAPGTSSMKSSIKSQDVIFKENVINFVGRVTKCIICDNLAKKYGLSPSMVNELLNEGFHDYRNKYKGACMEKSGLNWHDLHSEKRANYLNYVLIIEKSRVIHDAEFFVKDQLEILNEMSKLEFEIHALLRQTVVPLSFEIPKHKQLSESLQNSLLGIPQIRGCGTIYGKLTLHVSQELNHSVKQEIKYALDQHGYLNQYDEQLIQENVKQAGPSPPKVECGNKLQATLEDTAFARIKAENDRKSIETSNEKTGSLGCFMLLSKSSPNIEDGNIANKDSHLYAVTCAHCITECLPGVKVNVGNKLINLGVTECFIDDGERMDIAVVRVDEEVVPKCETVINMFIRDWYMYNGDAGDSDLCGRVVNKRGCTTGETMGIVTSNDYRMKSINNWNSNQERNFQFCGNYNILIGSLPGSNPEVEFSKSGDSGSTIYYEENSVDGITSNVIAVSLLQGSMTTQGKYYCTYSCHLKRSLEEVCNKHGYQMAYPRELNSINMKNS